MVIKHYIQLVILLVFILTPSSCVTVTAPENKTSHYGQTLEFENLQRIRKAFLQVKKSAEITFCEPETKKERKRRKKRKKKRKCIDLEIGTVGSSFAIANAEMTGMKGSMVLTAGHICSDTGLKEAIKEYGKTIDDVDVVYTMTDIEGNKYGATVIDFDVEVDLCTMFVKGFDEAYVPPIKRHLTPGDKVWNVAAPAAEFQKNMVPVFEGYYSGIDENGKSSYTIPAYGGSSGSPIVNGFGELVGVLVAMHSQMNHISYSPNLQDVYKFIIDSCGQCGLRFYIAEDKLRQSELKLEKPE